MASDSYLSGRSIAVTRAETQLGEARRLFEAAGATVVHLGVHRQGFDDDVMRALALEVGDEADSAGVFLLRRVPESLGLGPAKRGFVRDGHGSWSLGVWD